jgi:hypothetical protein
MHGINMDKVTGYISSDTLQDFGSLNAVNLSKATRVQIARKKKRTGLNDRSV